ncbi:unnamed protein product [Acanthoscelides obtectus]|uniref:Uncharacterized protein n=1 Tax=Acanthoscelides obtectus TaxID=200917 RepID=A0A9P0P621_ACAOB|nr:unnamed protein product [Acanthoscelides obtectus]CAK1657582.1 hypothetical protein AOBTE_LOCUS20425 [Acanthoscelides obtectus]
MSYEAPLRTIFENSAEHLCYALSRAVLKATGLPLPRKGGLPATGVAHPDDGVCRLNALRATLSLSVWPPPPVRTIGRESRACD